MQIVWLTLKYMVNKVPSFSCDGIWNNMDPIKWTKIKQKMRKRETHIEPIDSTIHEEPNKKHRKQPSLLYLLISVSSV